MMICENYLSDIRDILENSSGSMEMVTYLFSYDRRNKAWDAHKLNAHFLFGHYRMDISSYNTLLETIEIDDRAFILDILECHESEYIDSVMDSITDIVRKIHPRHIETDILPEIEIIH